MSCTSRSSQGTCRPGIDRRRPWRGVGLVVAALATAGCAPSDASPPAPTDPGSPETTADCEGVRFTDRDGGETDLTDAFTDGDHVTLRDDGTLRFCPGIWFVRLEVEADVAIVGSGADRTTLSGGEQGTVVAVRGAAVEITGVSIDRGRALGGGNVAKGGGVWCDAGSRVSIADSSVTNNRAYDGGGVYADDGCTLIATDVRFADNVAEDDGGAIGTYFGRRVALTRVVVEHNTARDGAAVFLFGSALEVADATFTDNVAVSHGGAIHAYDSPMTATDTTFAGNQGSVGGALLVGGETTLERVVFTDNHADTGGALFAYVSVTTTGTDCSFVANEPEDVVTSGGSYVLGEAVDFVCDGQGCVTEALP